MSNEKWNWLGDHIAIDLANTVRRCGGQTRELLEVTDDLAEWLHLERHRLPVPRHVDEVLLHEFIVLRNHCLDLLDAALAGTELPRQAVMWVNDIVASHPLPRILRSSTNRVETLPASSGDLRHDLKATLAAAIVDLLAAEDLYELAFCDAPSCGQFFHRRRPNQAWCCPACGDRARTARYHKRKRKPR
ncbi:CGNR zinc finger domain-containing protein [Chelativorans sp. YIM 93263]|uniref:CGNR zinc finger domain-containing protein n=1 Tax=Chelativorans sp. YIM 93263 TaxID=2906648 RepID=UPI002379C65D|nr:ABATE domain-containing protein [Chelativorans sp. YIM 93263]